MRKFLTVLIVVVCLALQSSAAYGSIRARMVKYKCEAIGTVIVTFSPYGVRIVMEQNGCTVVLKQPDWTSFVFNPEKKTYFKASRQLNGFSFLPMLRAFQAGKFTRLKATKSENEMLQGMPVKHILYKSELNVDVPQNKSGQVKAGARWELLAN